MPTTSPPPVNNPYLGTLERLPAELRNHIYQLAIDTEYELEAAYNKPCRQRQSLHFVSKKIHQETRGFLADAKARPCPHVNFSVTIPEPNETQSFLRMLEGIARQTHPAHDIAQAQTIRFITEHLAADAPLEVTCRLRLPHGSSCELIGGSEKKSEYVAAEIKSMLLFLEKRVQRFAFCSPLCWTRRDIEDLAGTVMVTVADEVDDYEVEEFALGLVRGY